MNAYRFAAIAAVAIAAIAMNEGSAHALPPKPPIGGTCYCTRQEKVCTNYSGSIPGALPGDLVFKQDAGNTGIAGVMHALGLNYTHVGMMMDNVNVRHNTVGLQTYVQNLEGTSVTDIAGYLLGGLHIGDVYIDPPVLASATVTTPVSGNTSFTAGTQTVNLSEMVDPDGAPSDPAGYFWPDQVTLVPARDAGVNRSRAVAAAQQFAQLSAGYSMYAYTYLDAALQAQQASMCAGSVFQAWRLAEGGVLTAGGFSEVLYLAQDTGVPLTPGYIPGRSTLANQLYSALYTPVRAAAVQVNDEHNDVLFDQDVTNAATSVTQQVVNAMAYGLFQDTGGNQWPVGEIENGLTVSPDDLYRQIQANGTAYAPAPTPAQLAANPATTQLRTVQRDYTTCSVVPVSVVCACGTGGGGNPGAQ